MPAMLEAILAINLFAQKMEKLREAIRQYLLDEGTSRRIASAKGRVTKLINELAAELGVHEARELTQSILTSLMAEEQNISEVRADLLNERLDTRSFYLEGDRVFGWYDPEFQVQAEELPLSHSFRSGSAYHVSFYRRREAYMLWLARGFEVAEDLPTIRVGEELTVCFHPTRSLFWLEYGYALPCKLPWHRGRFDGNGIGDDREECLWVSRSIISSGWWCAYKWWPDCQWWYYERHPEWFTEMDWWGTYEPEPVRHEPIDDPYAAVLGGMG